MQLYGLMAVMGVIVILAVQALVSLSILIYFRSTTRTEGHWWKTIVAPALCLRHPGLCGLPAVRQHRFLGGGYSYANWLGPIDLAVVARRHRLRVLPQEQQPEKYESAGRLINEGL